MRPRVRCIDLLRAGFNGTMLAGHEGSIMSRKYIIGLRQLLAVGVLGTYRAYAENLQPEAFLDDYGVDCTERRR